MRWNVLGVLAVVVLASNQAYAEEPASSPPAELGADVLDDEHIGEAQQFLCTAPNTLIAAACSGAPLACQSIPDPAQRLACAASVCAAVAAYVDMGCPPIRAPWPQWPYHR